MPQLCDRIGGRPWLFINLIFTALFAWPGARAQDAAAGAQNPPPASPDAVGEYLKQHPEVIDKRIEEYLKAHPNEVANGLQGGYDRGFYLKSTKFPNFDFKFNFLSQIWYDHISSEGTNTNLTGAPNNFTSTGDSFILRRAELKFSGHMFTDRLEWRFMFDPVREIGGASSVNEQNPELKRAVKDLWTEFIVVKGTEDWAKNLFTDKFSGRIGQMKTPQTMEGYNHAGNTDFPERSIIGYTFGDFREAGALAYGNFLKKRLDLYGGIFNGNGTNVFRDQNDQKDAVGRVVVHPLAPWIAEEDKKAIAEKRPKFILRDVSFGASGSTGLDGQSGARFDQDSGGLEGNFAIWKLFLRGEWYTGRPQGSNQTVVTVAPTNTAPRVEGWYATIGWDFLPHWQVAARWQEFDPSKSAFNDRVEQQTVGLTYFFDPSHSDAYHGAKIQAAYSFNNVHATTVSTPTGRIGDGDQFTLAFQVDF